MAFSVVTGDIDWWAVGMVVAGAILMLVGSALIGAILAEGRRRDALAGALLGMLFGPVGWAVILMVGRRRL